MMAALCKNACSKIFRSFVGNKVALCSAPVRWLNLQEYQSKQLMADHGIFVQPFKVADTPDQATDIARELIQSVNAEEFVIKAQILAGGRGKGTFSSGYKGGVKLTRDTGDIKPMVEQMLGYKLVTKQTPKDGVLVKKVMVAKALDISRETYFAILLDRNISGIVMVGSPSGGMDIEEVARKTPELIFTEQIDVNTGVTQEQSDRMAENLGFKGPLKAKASTQVQNLYKMFRSVDATQVEINPLGETPQGDVVCFDAKINFDDNARYRQKDVFGMDDMSETDPREVQANKYDLNYIGMDGNIACLVNGAGLAMATMDIIKLHGGEPANFLDVGGGVEEDQVTEAFKIITTDSRVKSILVNIFGGIVDCNVIAKGIVNACKHIKLTIPLVIRLEGTNVNAANETLNNSGLNIELAHSFEEAAKRAVSNLN